MATMVRTQTGTGQSPAPPTLHRYSIGLIGSYTLSAEEAANYQGLQIVSLAGRQGFASNARVHGFSTASATVTRTSASTGSYATTQTRTGTYTTTQTRTGAYTGMQNSSRTQTQNRARNAGVGTGKKPFFLKRWLKKLRLTKSPTIRKVKAKNAKLKKKEKNVKAQETQDRINTRIMTIWDVAAGSPAPDPGGPGGSKTAAVHDDAKGRRQKMGKLRTRTRRKSRIMTIWDVAAGSPAPDPGIRAGAQQ